MFQDEKTTELNLNPTSSQASLPQSPRWTEKPTPGARPSSSQINSAANLSLPNESHHLLLKIAAAVSILLLSLWLL